MELRTNDMECPNNPSFGHAYGWWEFLNEEEALGTCNHCKGKFKRRITDSIIEQKEKQDFSTKYVDAFLNVSLDDSNIILYLDQILNHLINYIDDERRTLLNNKIYELFSYSIISGEENEQSIKIITEAIRKNDLGSDTFLDELERFRNLNLDLINLSSENVVSYSR